jgi:hypothetical protein
MNCIINHTENKTREIKPLQHKEEVSGEHSISGHIMELI